MDVFKKVLTDAFILKPRVFGDNRGYFFESFNKNAFEKVIDAEFNFERVSVGLARTLKYDTEDSQFFIILDDEPLFEGEYTPIGKVIFGIKVLEKIRYSHRSEYVLRPDFINTVRMFK